MIVRQLVGWIVFVAVSVWFAWIWGDSPDLPSLLFRLPAASSVFIWFGMLGLAGWVALWQRRWE